METEERKECLYHGRTYSDGFKLYGFVSGIVCRNGVWHDLSEEDSESKPSLAYFYH